MHSLREVQSRRHLLDVCDEQQDRDCAAVRLEYRAGSEWIEVPDFVLGK